MLYYHIRIIEIYVIIFNIPVIAFHSYIEGFIAKNDSMNFHNKLSK